MTTIPLLFLGDSPDLKTGLGRIGRDLASLATSIPGVRIGYLGRGGIGSRQLPFACYNFPELDQWGEGHIERVWLDFAGPRQQGIVFSIWDPSRLLWFSRPEGIPDQNLRQFLQAAVFQRWGYFPVDAEGPNQRLTALATETIRGYDRPLAYGAWGADVIGRSLGRDVNWIPHGITFDTWTPRDKTAARMAMGFGKDDTVVGCVMSNQARKDWGLWATVMANLRPAFPRLRVWAHVDVMERSHSWNLYALIRDFGLEGIVKVTLSGAMSDEELSYWYSGCDLTVLPSLGEGFGYPIVESLACGVPVLHGKYAGGPELIPTGEWLIEPTFYRMEGLHNSVRPVYDPAKWVERCVSVLDQTPQQWPREFCRASVQHLAWKNLWPAVWKKWIEEGIQAR